MSTIAEAQNALVDFLIDSAPARAWTRLVLQHGRVDVGIPVTESEVGSLKTVQDLTA